MVVWLPESRICFAGNLFSALFGHFPNLVTIRGDRYREALEFVESLDRVLALEPEILLVGHHQPVVGQALIRDELLRLRGAVQYVHDETVRGMNAGKDVYTLMREITLPPELEVGQGYGKVSWSVRAIWETYAGWFQHRSTTELYGASPDVVSADLVELAGGPDAVAERAACAAGRRRRRRGHRPGRGRAPRRPGQSGRARGQPGRPRAARRRERELLAQLLAAPPGGRAAPGPGCLGSRLMSAAPIRIDDLANPKLSPLQQTVMEAAAKLPVSFTEEAVLGAAMERTGLSDFGPDDFRERLGVWLAALEEDSELGPVGRIAAHRDCVRYAANRLRLEDLLRRHPEILEVEIRRPIVIAGLPRSGTTHLLNLIAADPRLRSLPYWESLEPIPDPREPAGEGGVDPRLERCQKGYEQQIAISPLLRNMHDMSPEHVHEEIEIQALDFASYELEWIATVPRWRDYYLSHDQTPHYAYLKKGLQALQWLRGPDRWILKSPQHMEQLLPLMRVFPDATVAIPHRDPVSVIASAITMLTYGDRIRRTRVDPPAWRPYWIDRIEKLLRGCVRDRDQLPEGQVIDVLFHEFMADDIAMVERIYGLAGLPHDGRGPRPSRALPGRQPARQARPDRLRPRSRLRRSPRVPARALRLLHRPLSRGDRALTRTPPGDPMSRSTFRPIPFLLALGLLAAVGTPSLAKQPNVVIFVADDLGWADVGFHGEETIQTPSLDRLAKEGVQLDRFYTTPICSPTRAALMTGRDPIRLGVAYAVILPWMTTASIPTSTSCPRASAKPATRRPWSASGTSATRSRPTTPTSAASSTSTATCTPRSATSRPSRTRAARTSSRTASSIDDQGYETFLLADEASRWIRERDAEKRPFFLYMPFIAPHTPLDAPDDLKAKYADMDDDRKPARSRLHRQSRADQQAAAPGPSARPMYAAVVDAMDQAIGRVLDTLDEQGIADDTIVLFFSDNGGAAYATGGADNVPLRGGKGETFEGGIRVVAALRWPAKIEAGTKFESIMSVMDVFPTLAAAAGVTPLHNVRPRRPRPVARDPRGQAESVALKDYLFFASETPIRGSFSLTAFDDEWKLVQEVQQGLLSADVSNFLFKPGDDPYEHNNLAEEHPEVVARMADAIHVWRTRYPVSGTRSELVPPPGWRAPQGLGDLPGSAGRPPGGHRAGHAAAVRRPPPGLAARRGGAPDLRLRSRPAAGRWRLQVGMSYAGYQRDLDRTLGSEVLGERLFAVAARLTRKPERRAKWLALRDLETQTRQRIEAFLEERGEEASVPAFTGAQALLFGVALGLLPWSLSMRLLQDGTGPFLEIFERLERAADPDSRAFFAYVVAHERAIERFARSEQAGEEETSLDVVEALLSKPGAHDA